MSGIKEEFLAEAQRCGYAAMAAGERYRFLAEFVMRRMLPQITQARARAAEEKTAYYLSAEFLMGRMIHANLFNLGMLGEIREAAAEMGIDVGNFEEVPDHALGNGGLGRLAACFLDSAASQDIPMWGYGIRYRYGLFSQKLSAGFQEEEPDDWMRMGDPWSIRRESEAVSVTLGRRRVRAVPYDMPVFGYGDGGRICLLRLWQAESEEPLKLPLFEAGRYGAASAPRERAERISAVLYPGDATAAGKELRLSQEIFFTEASAEDILRRFEQTHGQNWEKLPEYAVIQLNDTHPTMAIPALIARLEGRGVPFSAAVTLTGRMFAYTNHTVMAEALEEWDEALLRRLAPRSHRILVRLQEMLEAEMAQRGTADEGMHIIVHGRVRMANLASFMSMHINGVARLHTEILKQDVLRGWHGMYPDRITNVTNGITQRRWLGVANPSLAEFVTERIGGGWLTEADQLSGLEAYVHDTDSLREFARIKRENKRRLVRAFEAQCGITADASMMFDIQITRLHEYKRQLMNAFSILRMYFDLREGAAPDFQPTAFIFGAKSAPGYARAKGIIRYILSIAQLVNNDPAVRERMQVIFVPDYNVSWAEKLVAAGDLSEQISMAGTEASGTGNMKFMLNGAPTLGTYDGANLEILEAAGAENNFFFGSDAQETARRLAEHDPRRMLEEDERLRRVVDTLIDGTFDDGGSGIFGELHHALTAGTDWHRADHYFVLGDFWAYTDARRRAASAWRDADRYAAMGLANTAAAGRFSSDRSVREYAERVWRLGRG